MRDRRISGRIAATAILGGALTLLPLTAANAAGVGSVVTVTTPDAAVPFDSDWSATVRVVAATSSESAGGAPAEPSDGVIDVYLAGVPGIFADDVPIQPGGVAFITQPDAGPVLPAGSYEMTAVFVPTAGSNLEASQGVGQSLLQITPIAVVADYSLDETDGIRSLDLSLSGDYVDETGQAPTGIWTVDIGTAGGDAVFSTEVAQSADPAPLTVPVDAELDPGKTYEVNVSFTADAALVGGLQVTAPQPSTFETPEAGPLDALAAPVELSTPAAIGLGAVAFLLLLAAAIFSVVTARRSRRRGGSTGGEAVPEEPVGPDGSAAERTVDASAPRS